MAFAIIKTGGRQYRVSEGDIIDVDTLLTNSPTGLARLGVPDDKIQKSLKDITAAFPQGDPRRGWDFRAPGHGGVDWENLMRALSGIGYNGPLSIEWSDAAIDRDHGAAEACAFVKRLDYPPRVG